MYVYVTVRLWYNRSLSYGILKLSTRNLLDIVFDYLIVIYNGPSGLSVHLTLGGCMFASGDSV